MTCLMYFIDELVDEFTDDYYVIFFKCMILLKCELVSETHTSPIIF